ncbi:hypothetical protein ACHQM5_010036 [Ranunculus cassubicifolius]
MSRASASEGPSTCCLINSGHMDYVIRGLLVLKNKLPCSSSFCVLYVLGKYYLADAGYANVTGFLTPYRSVQYHLKDIEWRTPENAKELYNFRHSSLRNVVERTIGVLKKRFAYLRNGTFHDVETQAKIVFACCAMHNFLRDIDPEDEGRHPDDTREEEEEEDEDEEQNVDYPYLNIASTPEWTHKRDALKDRMWEDYLAN